MYNDRKLDDIAYELFSNSYINIGLLVPLGKDSVIFIYYNIERFKNDHFENIIKCYNKANILLRKEKLIEIEK